MLIKDLDGKFPNLGNLKSINGKGSRWSQKKLDWTWKKLHPPATKHGPCSLTSGGIVNLASGAGTALDKSEGSFFTPTRIYWRTPLEVLCVQSWAAANFVSIPIDDMFIRWRNWGGEDESAIEAMMAAEKEHRVLEALRSAMTAARQYGTGVVAIMSREAPMEEPLMIERA